jgi:outer membrane protein
LSHSKRIIAAVLASGLLAAGPAMAQVEAAKIGFVSIDRILRDAAPAKRAQDKIEREFKKRDEELGKMADQLKKMQDTLDKQGPVMADADRRKLEKDFNDTNRDFQRKQREFRDDVNQRRNEELQGILDRANRVVKEIAERDKYDIIFQDAVWASGRIDLTDQVIKALEDTKNPIPPAGSGTTGTTGK